MSNQGIDRRSFLGSVSLYWCFFEKTEPNRCCQYLPQQALKEPFRYVRQADYL